MGTTLLNLVEGFMDFIRTSLKKRLVLQFLLVALIPIGIVEFLSFTATRDALDEAAFEKVQMVNDINRERLLEYFEEVFTDLDMLSRSANVSQALDQLDTYHQSSGQKGNEGFDISSAAYQKLYKKIDPFLRDYLVNYEFDDLMLICASHGHVMYSAAQESDFGANLNSGPLATSALAKAWKQVNQGGEHVVLDFVDYEPSGEPIAFAAVPVHGSHGQVSAVLIVKISIDAINEIVENHGQFGATGESYVVGNDYMLRSELRFAPGQVLKKRVESSAIDKALNDKPSYGFETNYDGKRVLGAYEHIGLNERFGLDFEWVVVSEIEEQEALAPVEALRLHTLLISLPVAVLACLFGWWAAVKIVAPVRRMLFNFERLAEGDLEQADAHVTCQDELGRMQKAFAQMLRSFRLRNEQLTQIAAGDLNVDVEIASDRDTVGQAMQEMVDSLKAITVSARHISEGDLSVEIVERSERDELGLALKMMITNLRDIIGELVSGTSTLAASVSQLSTTSSLLAASAAETSSSMAEVTATVDEVRQTSQVSSDRAREVANASEEASSYSEKGSDATQKTVTGMNVIKEEMDYIAESIVSLSEQSQSVGAIVDTVTDLADQSNLLSVNASIEAAKAGEHGKGFTVVAQEVKSLAAQSKQATEQIKRILNDIQKATGSAVMATERGTKAVQAGVDLMSQSEETFQVMTENINTSAEFALQIATSNQQQLAGVEQVAQAMLTIKDAGQQNMDSARQLEDATLRLESLANNLKQLSERFTL
jgi:methyl-accepting chemotaxis protein